MERIQRISCSRGSCHWRLGGCLGLTMVATLCRYSVPTAACRSPPGRLACVVNVPAHSGGACNNLCMDSVRVQAVKCRRELGPAGHHSYAVS
jgi:hypothetical protein